MKKLTIEYLANYCCRKLKSSVPFDLNKMVMQIGDSPNFIYKLLDKQGKITKVYLVQTSSYSIGIKDQPWYPQLLEYFDKPEYKYISKRDFFILKIQLDKNNEVHKSKQYRIPSNYQSEL